MSSEPLKRRQNCERPIINSFQCSNQNNRIWMHIGLYKRRRRKVLLPERAGVNTPSPITMQAPSKTIRSRKVLDFLCLSRYLPNGEYLVEYPGLWYAWSSSSTAWWLGSKLNSACLSRREYRAKVPPAKKFFKIHSGRIICSSIIECDRTYCMKKKRIERLYLHHYHSHLARWRHTWVKEKEWGSKRSRKVPQVSLLQLDDDSAIKTRHTHRHKGEKYLNLRRLFLNSDMLEEGRASLVLQHPVHPTENIAPHTFRLLPK